MIDVPPAAGVLHDRSARFASGGYRDVLLPRQRAGERDEPDLRAARPEVDGEDESLLAWPAHKPAGTVSWESIMPAMTIWMKASASSVMPPATPP